MSEKTKIVIVTLVMTVMTVVYFWLAADHYTLYLWDIVEIPEWIFDICACAMGLLFGVGSVVLWIDLLRKK